jgi:SAM-dependent methyltransferase
LNHARAMLTPTTEVSPLARLRTLRLAAQRLVLRLTRPYWWGQRQLTGLLIDAIQGVEETRKASESSLAERLDALESSVSGFHRSAAAHLASLTESVSRLEAQATDLLNRLYPVPYMSNPEMFVFEDASGRKALGFQAVGESCGRYIGFEDIFRGSEDFIRDRFRAYRRLLEQADTVVDVGCGRGELLELVRELGKTGIGVDTDEEMVRRCLAKGLNATHGDALEFLRSQKDSSIGLLFGSQIIEHMSHETVNVFFDLAFQKLKPQGILIAETVNPHSLEALKSFWVDLTHQHPIFPEVALALCWLRGFASASIMFPHGSGELETDRRTQGEYAIVARKSAGSEGRNRVR